MKAEDQNAITKLPNVGKVLAGHLTAIGIQTPAQLSQTGAKETFQLIRAFRDPSACLHMLYGIEGAIQGIPDKYLTKEKKQELKEFYQALQKENAAKTGPSV